MSILNVVIDRDRALVGVDTEGRGAHGRTVRVGKMLPFPHISLVVASTGSALFLNNLGSACHFGSGFDGLAEQMPEALPMVYRFMLESARQNNIAIGGNVEQQSAVIIGWSAAQKRMAGRCYVQQSTAEGFIQTEIQNGMLQPWVDDPRWRGRFEKLPHPNTPEALGRYAQEQTRVIREFIPDIHAGGQFIVAEITRDRMTIAPVCDLP